MRVNVLEKNPLEELMQLNDVVNTLERYSSKKSFYQTNPMSESWWFYGVAGNEYDLVRKVIRAHIREQIKAKLEEGCDVTDAWLLKHGKDFIDEIRMHPRFYEYIVPKAIKGYAFYLIPDDVKKIFVW